MREIKNDHCTLGYTQHTLSSRGKEYPIVRLSVWEHAREKGHQIEKVGISLHGEGKFTCVGLSDTAALELTKGLLQELCKRPICFAADDEFRKFLKVVQGQIAQEDENAEQIVAAAKRRTDGLLSPNPQPVECNCGAERTGPSAEAHAKTCPAK